jgi:hypothetical protein
MWKVAIGLLLALASTASAQEADPTKSKQSPWPVDQRCGVMAAHGFNQAYLNCGAVEGQKQFIEQSKGFRIHVQPSVVLPPVRHGDGQTQPNRD